MNWCVIALQVPHDWHPGSQQGVDKGAEQAPDCSCCTAEEGASICRCALDSVIFIVAHTMQSCASAFQPCSGFRTYAAC